MFDLDKLKLEILELEKKSSDQNLWKDNNSAKNFLKQLMLLKYIKFTIHLKRVI